jgi:hypothetical protein
MLPAPGDRYRRRYAAQDNGSPEAIANRRKRNGASLPIKTGMRQLPRLPGAFFRPCGSDPTWLTEALEIPG